MKTAYSRTRLLPVLLIFLLLGTSLHVLAQANAGMDAEENTGVTEFEIDGLKVILKQRQNAKTIAGGVFFKGGVRNQDSKNAGIENLALSVATEGSKKYPRTVIRRELSRTGSYVSSSSTLDFSVLNFSTTSENFPSTWQIFIDVLKNPAFAKADLNRVREQLLAALKERDSSPDNNLESLRDKNIFAGHAYENDVLGTEATISQFTSVSLAKYHRSLLNKSKMLLVIVGGMDSELMKSNIEKAFKGIPTGNYMVKTDKPLDFSQSTIDIVSRKIPTNYITGVFNAPSLGDKDYYAMRVAITILRNRLFEEIREKRQLSYAPSADMEDHKINQAYIYVTAVESNKTVGLMLSEMKKLRDVAVEADEIKRVVGGFLTDYYLEQETNVAQAKTLAEYELIGTGWKNSFSFLEKLSEVTPADVQRVSKTYMKNLRFAVVGDPESVDKKVFLQSLE
ncbi:MAG: pitrilysin family protein [Pyrinomonadaceae bacterium]